MLAPTPSEPVCPGDFAADHAEAADKGIQTIRSAWDGQGAPRALDFVRAVVRLLRMISPAGSASKVARVAIDVRLYLDVPVASAEPSVVFRAAVAELERATDTERILLSRLSHPAVFPLGDGEKLKPADFTLCEVCDAADIKSGVRVEL